MLLNLNVYDKNRGNRGNATLQLDFLTKRWSIPSGQEKGWSGVGHSYPAQGYFEMKSSDGMYLFDQSERCSAVLANPPASETDIHHRFGQARIVEPRDPALKEGSIDWSLAARAGGGLTSLRQWVISQLSELTNVLTDENKMVRSNDKATKDLFTKWTGYTQTGLEYEWICNGFYTVDTPEEKKKHPGAVWYRVHGHATTTSCEALVGRMLGKIRNEFFGGKPPVSRKAVGSFNLAGLTSGSGKEPATTPGWHWLRDGTAGLKPQRGDMFQIGKPVGTGQWSLRHVGIILNWQDSDNPIWETLEAGQGGPASGFDAIKKKGPKPVNPVDKRDTGKVLMGWLNIEEYFGASSTSL